MGQRGSSALIGLIDRGAVQASFQFGAEEVPVLALMRKYADVPMSLADACLIRMTELLPGPLVLTTDADFRVYRRNGRQMVPCALPS